MKNHFDKSVSLRTILIIGLFLIVVFITGSGISCKSQAPTQAPPASSPGLTEKPTIGEPPATPSQIEVAIVGFAFRPATLNIPVGTTVIWYNNDSTIHTVTARDNSFDSGSLSGGDTFSYTFEERGSFEYYCVLHPYMTGKVTVE